MESPSVKYTGLCSLLRSSAPQFLPVSQGGPSSATQPTHPLALPYQWPQPGSCPLRARPRGVTSPSDRCQCHKAGHPNGLHHLPTSFERGLQGQGQPPPHSPNGQNQQAEALEEAEGRSWPVRPGPTIPTRRLWEAADLEAARPQGH